MRVTTQHTMIRVRDLAAAMRFYAEAFGYAVRSRRPGPHGSEIAFMRLPDEAVELQLAHFPGEPDFRVPARLMHLAFRVDDLDALVQGAVQAGATLVEPPYVLPSGSRVAFLTDPDGYPIELIQKPAP